MKSSFFLPAHSHLFAFACIITFTIVRPHNVTLFQCLFLRMIVSAINVKMDSLFVTRSSFYIRSSRVHQTSGTSSPQILYLHYFLLSNHVHYPSSCCDNFAWMFFFHFNFFLTRDTHTECLFYFRICLTKKTKTKKNVVNATLMWFVQFCNAARRT